MGVRGTWWKEPRGAAPTLVPVTGLVSCRFGGRGVSESTDDDDAGLSIFPTRRRGVELASCGVAGALLVWARGRKGMSARERLRERDRERLQKVDNGVAWFVSPSARVLAATPIREHR